MKSLSFVLLCAAVHVAHGVHPIHKIMELLSNMQRRIISEGADFQRMYQKYSRWCEDRSRELHQEIKVANAQIANLEGTMEQQSDHIVSLDTKIGELSAQLSTDESDVKAIGLIRKKEKKEFDATQIEMRDMISALQKAITVLEREIKGGASMAQLQSTGDIVKVFGAMVEANALNSADAKTLTALVQSSSKSEQTSESDDEEDMDALGAPDSDQAYESKSSSIVETLESLLDKAQNELDEARSAESEKNSNFELLKQLLENRIKLANKAMEDTKKAKAEAGEAKATAEGDLSVTKTDVAQDIATLGGLHHKCMAKAEDFQQETKARAEELGALAKAKDIIKKMLSEVDLQQVSDNSSSDTSDEDSSNDLSFVQMKMLSKIKMTSKAASKMLSSSKGGAPIGVKVVHLLKKRAKELQSLALAQFAQNLDSTVRAAAVESRNPLASVKQLISDMIKSLEKEASEAADHKAYCDRELAHASEKVSNKQDDIEGLSTRVDKMRATAAQLKGQLAILQRELGELTRTQSEMDKIREDEKAAVKKHKPEMEDAIKATQMAMQVLRDFYAQDGKSEGGASSNIVGMLEVMESDFSKELSNMLAEEEAAQAAYEETTNENEVSKAAKEQDVKFKTSRSKTLAKAASELASDRDSMQAELDAATDYLDKVKEMCMAKPEPYEERKKRQQAELASLREALELLFGETSLLQEGSSTKRLLRGVSTHAQLEA